MAGTSLLRLQSDQRLLALARAGHEPGFEAIVERYRADLVRYAERLAGPSRAEDVVQQAFLNAHLAMHRTEDISNLRAWLHRVTHNAAVSTLRGSQPAVALGDDEVAPGAIHDDLEVRERLHAALAAIARLPEPQRDALTLRAIEGRSQEEVAAALGVSAGAARQHIHRARSTLRAAVTAITPYGLLVRFALAGGAGQSPELVAGAGAGAGIGAAKVAATFLAAGAIAGGATQLPHAVHRHHHAHAARPAPADSATSRPVADDSGRAPVPETAALGPGMQRGRGGELEHHHRGRGSGSRRGGEVERRGSDDGSRHRSGDDDNAGRGSGDDGGHRGSGEDFSGSDRRGSSAGSDDGGRSSGGSGTSGRDGSSDDLTIDDSGSSSGGSGSSDGSFGSTSGDSGSGSSSTSGDSGSSDHDGGSGGGDLSGSTSGSSDDGGGGSGSSLSGDG